MLQLLHSSKYSGNTSFRFSSAVVRHIISNVKHYLERSLFSFMVRIEMQVWNSAVWMKTLGALELLVVSKL